MARLSRLCCLISTSLVSNQLTGGGSSCGVSEKQLLLFLTSVAPCFSSSVYREVQNLCPLQDSGDGIPDIAHDCAARGEKGSEGEFTCLDKIVLTMVSFFEHDSEFVQHLAAKILFQISTFLEDAAIVWVKFLLFVWIVLANAMSSICGCALPCCLFQNAPFLKEIAEHSMNVLDMGSSEIERFSSVLQSTHANLTSRTVIGPFQVLHQMVKHLKNKENKGGELQEKFIVLSVKFLRSLPWDFYEKVDFGLSKLKSVLSGCILQFVCSLVQANDSEDSQHTSLEVSNLHLELGDLVPKFPSIFFGLSYGRDKCLLHYMKHKTLMLMIRLCLHAHKMGTTHIISLLKSLKQYFPDLIYKPFSNYIVTPDCSTEESPFFSSCSSELGSQNPQTRHLQRQALLLFFMCCFRLMQASNGIVNEQCFCGKYNSSTDCGTLICCCNNIGWSEISDWLKYQVDTLKSPMDFGLSFLQLFMDEDNMLFCMLLQFLDVSAVAFHIESKRMCYNELHFLSSVINPVCLFHILLFLLKYDHMVLVDYLMSKDTGLFCAQYLLRCLRFVSESWPSFAKFSASQSEVIDANNKRRKLSDEDDGFKINQAFRDAKDCLISLKKTLEDLHRKNLFPYNPKALLRSLSRFEGLCGQ